MVSERDEGDADRPSSTRRTRWSWWLTGLGGVVVLVAVLRVANAGYGTSPKREFAQRRSYDMVKRDVHKVLPGAIIQGLAGLGIVLLSARLRR